MEVDADSELSAASKASFLDKVRQSNQACQSGDFETAVGLYGEAIALDPCNHILFSNRSAALVKLGHFARALQDASRAVELNAKWPKVSPVQSRPVQLRSVSFHHVWTWRSAAYLARSCVSVSQVDIMCLMANIRRAGGGWRGGEPCRVLSDGPACV